MRGTPRGCVVAGVGHRRTWCPRLLYHLCGFDVLLQHHKQRNSAQKTLTSGVIGLFTGPHHTSFLDESSSTIRLSDGERPVLAPEYAESAPLAVMAEPVSYTRASS